MSTLTQEKLHILIELTCCKYILLPLVLRARNCISLLFKLRCKDGKDSAIFGVLSFFLCKNIVNTSFQIPKKYGKIKECFTNYTNYGKFRFKITKFVQI